LLKGGFFLGVLEEKNGKGGKASMKSSRGKSHIAPPENPSSENLGVGLRKRKKSWKRRSGGKTQVT